MAEKRMLGRAVSQSRKVNSLSLKAALLWTWAISWFDVSGFMEAEPDFLKSNIVLRRKDFTEEEIPFLVTEIIESGLWEEFVSSDGKRIVREIKFFDFQNVRETHEAKSKFVDSVKRVSKKRRRKTIPYEIRQEVFERDKFVCQYCGVKCQMGFWGVSYDDDYDNAKCITLDHKIPISKGGDDSIGNLITSCFHCNASKCDRNSPKDRPITDQLQTKDEPTPAQVKLNEVKLNEVKLREGKERECEGKPNPEPIVDNSNSKGALEEEKPEKLTDPEKLELAILVEKIKDHYKSDFRPLLWLQNNLKLNPRTHLHVMKRIAEEWPDFPKAYADKIAYVEDGNYNERETMEQHQENKNLFTNLLNKIKQLDNKETPKCSDSQK